MISFEDCLALCGLTQDEVEAIAEHEHVPEIAAAMLGHYLVEQHQPDRIRRMIIDDIKASSSAGEKRHAARLVGVLRHFLATHPAAQP